MSISFSSLLQAGDEYNLREFLGSEGQFKIQYLDWIQGRWRQIQSAPQSAPRKLAVSKQNLSGLY